MEPIQETIEAAHELEPFADEGDLLERLNQKAERVKEIVPDCIGVSVASRVAGVTFTLVATDEEIAVLDAVQYLAAGPCVDAIETGQGVETTHEDLFNEDRWRTFGQATAAAGVRSTLTFPVVRAGQVVGSVNLYGGSGHAFSGHHRELAEVFQAWLPGAVTNADLPFETRSIAKQAPEILKTENRVDVATGILAASADTDLEDARARLEEAAARAGVTVGQLSEAVIRLGGLGGP